MTLDEHKALIIGYDYEAGADTDTDIDSLLGHDTMLFDGKPIRCDDTGCFEAPRYSEDIEITKLELEKLKIDPLLFQLSLIALKDAQASQRHRT